MPRPFFLFIGVHMLMEGAENREDAEIYDQTVLEAEIRARGKSKSE